MWNKSEVMKTDFKHFLKKTESSLEETDNETTHFPLENKRTDHEN